MGQHELVVPINVKAPPERVWRVLADLKGYRKWLPDVASLQPAGDGKAKVGTRFRVTARIGNHTLASHVEIVTVEPNRRLAWRHLEEVLDGEPFTMATDGHTEFRLARGSEGTRLESRTRFTARGLKARLGAGYFLNHYVKPEIEGTLARLRALCE